MRKAMLVLALVCALAALAAPAIAGPHGTVGSDSAPPSGATW